MSTIVRNVLCDAQDPKGVVWTLPSIVPGKVIKILETITDGEENVEVIYREKKRERRKANAK